MLTRFGRLLGAAVGAVLVVGLGGLIVALVGILAYDTLADDSPPGVEAPAETLSGLPYVGHTGDPGIRRLDLHLPERAGRAVPAVVLTRTGTGAPGEQDGTGEQDVAHLVRDGFAVAEPDQGHPQAGTAAAQDSAQAAARWLRDNAAEYGLDPHRVASWDGATGDYRLIEAQLRR